MRIDIGCVVETAPKLLRMLPARQVGVLGKSTNPGMRRDTTQLLLLGLR